MSDRALKFPPDAPFTGEIDPEDPEWIVWRTRERGMFADVYGKMRARRAPDGRGQLRLWPTVTLTNMNGVLHGGAVLGFIDIALFAGAVMAGCSDAIFAVTVDCSAQFLAPARPDRIVDAFVEIVRETGRMVFLRGDVMQGETRVSAFSAIIRKTRPAFPRPGQ